MDRNYPTLYLYGPGDAGGADAIKVRIAFSRERKGPQDRDEPDWTCRIVCIAWKELHAGKLISAVQHQQLCYTASMLPMSGSQVRYVSPRIRLATVDVGRLRCSSTSQGI
jgi:hypothetical protein